jgi:hypothetical protein
MGNFEVFSDAKSEAKERLLAALLGEVGDAGFDMISFASLLAQVDGGEEGVSNPLHVCFSRSAVAKASLFIKACELVDRALACENTECAGDAVKGDGCGVGEDEREDEEDEGVIIPHVEGGVCE